MGSANIPAVSQIGGYVTKSEALAITGVHKRTLDRAIGDGRLRAVRLDGRTIMIRRDGLEHIYPRRRRSPGAEPSSPPALGGAA